MSRCKICLICPECGHLWDEHLPILDKLTDVYLAAEAFLESLAKGLPAEGYYQTKLANAVAAVRSD